MKKSIFLFFAAILCATNAWAGPTFKGGCVYFHNKGGWNDSYKYICISHDSWTEPRSVTVITNTQLWYNALPTSGWTDAKYMSAMGHSSSKSASNFKVSSCNHYTKNVSLGDWGFNSGNAQMLTPANGNNNAALELTYMGNSYSSMNRTITVKAKVSTDNGSSFAEATSPGTLSASSFAFTSYTSCKSAKTLSSGKITCGYTANTSLTAADADGYIFAGWYDASGNKQTEELTLSLNPTADATYYAYYTRKALAEETHDVTVSYMCGATSIKAFTTASGVGVSTASEITAPVIAGYNFSNWTLGSGVQSADANANPISITTKASGDYTLTANYTEIPKATIYFVNNADWSKVQAYAWDGSKGANPGWPGADITANKLAEKIGEYDVYSYTVEQGSYGKVIFNNGSVQTADYVWTDGNYYWYDSNIKKEDNFAGGTKAQAEEKFSVPVEYDYVYLINTNDWAKAHIYTWTPEVAGWPGAQMTKEATQIAGKDVYSYKVVKGTTFGGLNFNCGGDECKTGNLTWQAGKYYAPSKDTWYADAAAAEAGLAPDPLATGVYLAGDMTNKDNWDVNKKEFKKETAEATTASVTVTLAAQTYKFKLVVGGAWKGNTGTMQRGGDAVHEGGWSFDKDGYDDNCQIVADIAGDYTFTWNLTDKKLTVAYPPLPKHQVTATVNPAETGEVTGTGEYEQGSEATLVATPAAGYAFKNWTVGGTEKSTEATYTFTVNEPISLVANFIPEVTHEVTVSYLCNSNPIPGHDAHTLAVGITTPSTITAPAITNYKFDSWTVGTGVQAVDATANPIQITTLAEGEYTLTANYTKIELTYTVTVPTGTEKCYIAGEMTSWSFQEMTPTANANEFTITIDGATTAHKYKYACGDGWAYVEKKADGSELDADRTYNANDVVAKWAEPAKCYLMGIGGDWTTGIEMEEDGDQFKLLCQPIAESEQFKFKYGDTWTTDVENYDANGVAWVESYPGSGQYNITLPAGNYDFYYKKNENKVWIGVCTPATPETYTRTVTPGNYGTICLPYASSSYTGAEFYEVSWLQKSGETPVNLYLDQLADGNQLVAGKPYIFRATSSELTVTYTGEAVAAPVPGANGLTGSFDAIPAEGVLTGNYVIAQNKFWTATAEASAPANRAYINAAIVPTTEPAKVPGRRRVSLGAAGENAETGVDNIITTDAPVKVIENGQLIIIRNGEKHNVQGQKL